MGRIADKEKEKERQRDSRGENRLDSGLRAKEGEEKNINSLKP
jgi:hypothetical protein